MKKTFENKADIQLLGLSVRTNNKDEREPKTAKIGALVKQFWGSGMAMHIPNRKNPGTTLSVYTDYESDEHGDYTYFIGEEVTSLNNVPDGLHPLTIPAAQYQKFTTPTGKMPDVVIAAWQKIWAMTPEDLGAKRAYLADFEVYDTRAADLLNASVDIYIGIY